ncbi:sigma-70 family RNA polymerase sigma factor [Egibacter rhizosphaerae]|uniref:Sigma-70 family RNA polymerase sigma factor n=1 Tax=Egibacter rhizosphaerae TaxID=1670831 RepID=A0A411YFH4_9ACTN|nr:sigma-70 family RNA polymerase sigma factor [Egibacter rhizosphaerae]QBI19980.1 sigma-70 family RNA polymerase sigma factor [Egibacter rhizosphaerae]
MDETGRDEAEGFCSAQFPRLVGGLSLHLGDRRLAEEVAQEALLRAFARWEHVRGLDNPAGWTWRVALNLANSTFRRRAAERRASQRLAGGPPSGESSATDGSTRIAIRHAVARLPKRQRTVIVLRFYLDLPVAEAATHMGVSENAVRSLTKRAVAALRVSFGDDVPTDGPGVPVDTEACDA